MTRILAKPFHHVTTLKAWEYSTVDVMPHVLLDRCYEVGELWAKDNLGPVLDHAPESRVMIEPFMISIERSGRGLRFPDDRRLLVEIDGWTLFNQRKFLLEGTFYRCERKKHVPYARVLMAMTGVQIGDPETWWAEPGPLAPVFFERVTEFPGDHGQAAARYLREMRRLKDARWLGDVSFEWLIGNHHSEFSGMAVFMNHAPQLAVEGIERLLTQLKRTEPDLYPIFARARILPSSLMVIEMSRAFWGGDTVVTRGRCARQDGRLYFDFEVWTERPRRQSERYLVVFDEAAPLE